MKHGIVLVKKEKGISSYDVIRILKRTFHTGKIGHAGTLDPFASGLLIIGINEGTKILPYLENETKEYIAELTLGKATDTFDVTGKVVKEKKWHKHTNDEINKVLNSFVGKYLMTPPVYSAIKIKGKPSYEYARKDKKVKLKAREQIIYDVRLIANGGRKIIFYVKCNKGTYIRSFGVDLAYKLKEVGYLSNLERIAIGPHKIANVKKAELISENNIINLEDALKIPKVEFKDINKIKNGMKIKLKNKEEMVLIMNKNKALALYALNHDDMMYYCKRGFRYENL